MLVEKYRPQSLDEIVGQDNVISAIKRVLSRKDLPHFMFVGPPGTGKTTTAECIARERYGNQWGRHYKEFNASDTRKIEDVRNIFKPVSKQKGDRILFLDESERMTIDAQHAMRRIMEKTKSTTFILAGNRKGKFIPALISRCPLFVFRRLSDEAILKRVLYVIKEEGIRLDLKDPKTKEGLKLLVKDSKGDMRYALNTLEKYIDEKKALTVESLLALKKPQLAGTALDKAIAGDFQTAKELLQDAYIETGYSHEEIIEVLYESLKNVVDADVRIRLYAKLGETDAQCHHGSEPLVQLVAFIAYAWVAPRLTKCPALERVNNG